jgi:hypothetical protein
MHIFNFSISVVNSRTNSSRKKRNIRISGSYHISSHANPIDNKLLRSTHNKLIVTHNILMAMFSDGMAKRQHEDGRSFLPPSPPTDTTWEVSKLAMYAQSHYPMVRFWTRREWKDFKNSTDDATNLNSKAGPHGGTRLVQHENVNMLYLEHEDSTSVDGDTASNIRVYARMIWRDLYHQGKAPKKWGKASKEARDMYFCEMENKWEILRYCNNHWKANKIATSGYLIWYHPYHKKVISDSDNKRKNKAHDKCPAKKARTISIDSEDKDTGSPKPGDHVNRAATSESDDEDTDVGSSHRPIRLENPAMVSQSASRPKARLLKDPL